MKIIVQIDWSQKMGWSVRLLLFQSKSIMKTITHCHFTSKAVIGGIFCSPEHDADLRWAYQESSRYLAC